MYPAIFGVYGESGSGKTKLIIDIIKRLTKEKFKIGSKPPKKLWKQ